MTQKKAEKPAKSKKSKVKIPQTVKSILPQVNGITLTDEQANIAKELSKTTKQVNTLGGLAGTGKSTIVSHLIKELKGYAACAFTGRAAEVLRSKGIEASTIHSLIYTPRTIDGDITFIKKPCLDCCGVIVDEASMVGKTIYEDLLSFGVPIIFVGDHGQLEPVGEDVYLMANPDYKLETIHRNAGDIALFAHHLRDGKPAETFHKSEMVNIINKADCKPHILEADQIICALNSTRVAINKFVRELKGIKTDEPLPGDRIISLRNSRKLGIYNGTQGEIQAIRGTKLVLSTSDNKVVVPFCESTFNKERQDNFNYRSKVHPMDFAYAITAHKSQGGEWDTVMAVEQVCPLWDHRRWAYTVASRAKKKLVWVLAD